MGYITNVGNDSLVSKLVKNVADNCARGLCDVIGLGTVVLAAAKDLAESTNTDSTANIDAASNSGCKINFIRTRRKHKHGTQRTCAHEVPVGIKRRELLVRASLHKVDQAGSFRSARFKSAAYCLMNFSAEMSLHGCTELSCHLQKRTVRQYQKGRTWD